MGISFTLVETVNTGVAVSGESIAVERTSVVRITVSIRVGVSVVATIKDGGIGFRLSLGNSGKGENYDGL